MSKKKQIGNAVLQVILFVLATVTLICAIFQLGILDADKLFRGVVNEEFDQALLETVEQDFETGQSVIAFSYEELYDALDKDAFLSDCHQYTRSAVETLLTGSDIILYESSHKEIEKAVRRQFETFAQESGKEVSEDDIAEITGLLQDRVNARANYLPKPVVQLLSKVGSGIYRYDTVLTSVFGLAAILALILVVILFLLNQNNVARAAYKSSIAMWMATAAVFIPAMIFCSYDVGDRLKLKSSGLAAFVQGVVNTAEHEIKVWTVTAFGVMTVILILCMTWYSVVQTKRHKQYTRRKA